jgi:hypothetical protein
MVEKIVSHYYDDDSFSLKFVMHRTRRYECEENEPCLPVVHVFRFIRVGSL